MSFKKKFWDTLFDDEITEEEGRKLDEVVDEVEVDEIEETDSMDLRGDEKMAEGGNATVQEPIGMIAEKSSERASNPLNGSQTVFVEPKNYSECKKIANYIKEEKTVTVNLENLDGANAQRILDFLSGASSIKEANFIPVSKRVYVVVPKNVDVLFDGANKLKGSSMKIID